MLVDTLNTNISEDYKAAGYNGIYSILPGLAEELQRLSPLIDRIVQTEEQLDQLVDRLKVCTRFALDTETTGPTKRGGLHIPTAQMVGIALAFGPEEGWYIPLGHISTDRQLPTDVVLAALKPYLEREGNTIFMHHAKYDIKIMEKFGIKLPMVFSQSYRSIEDSMIAAWLLDENQALSLKELALNHIGMGMNTFKSLFTGKSRKKVVVDDEDEDGGANESELTGVVGGAVKEMYDISKVAVSLAGDYAKDDAIATYKLCEKFLAELEEENLIRQYYYELCLTPCLVRMAGNGVKIDTELAYKKRVEHESEIDELEREIKERFLDIPNCRARIQARIDKLSKVKQQQTSLYDELKLGSSTLKSALFYQDMGLLKSTTRKTDKGNPSSDAWALQALVREGNEPEATEMEKKGGEIALLLLRHSKLRTMVNTFLIKLPAMAYEGRIYTSFNPTGTVTGRLSGDSPNLMNMPREGLRDIFIVDDETLEVDGQTYRWWWFATDANQLELRMCAALSKDAIMMEVYNNNMDIHSKTAAQMSGKTPEDFPLGAKDPGWKELRVKAKPVGFGTLYGLTGRKLYDSLINDYDIPPDKTSVKECEDMIGKFFQEYKGVSALKMRQNAMACNHGYVTTIFGRKRRLLNATDPGPKPPYGDKQRYQIWRDKKAKFEADMRISLNTVIQGCLMGGTRIMTKERGYDKIENSTGETVTIWDGERYVKAFVAESGLKERVRITFEGGNFIDCSPDHRFLTINTIGTRSWRTPKEFTKQMYIQFGGGVPEWSSPLDIPAAIPGRAHNARRDCVSSIYDRRDLGIWLGRVASDGTLNKGKSVQLRVAEHEETILPMLETLCAEIGKYTCEKVRCGHGDSYMHSIRFNSASLSNQLVDCGLKCRIPDFVWRDSQVLSGYLSGLFDGDGTVTGDTISLCFGNNKNKPEWVYDVQQALTVLGIRARVQWYYDRAVIAILRRDAPLFIERIGFLNPVKQRKSAAIPKTTNWRGSNGKIYGEAYKVKSVEYTGEYVPMYDVLNSETSKYMANGLVTHNSAADMIKLFMVRLDRDIETGKWDVFGRRPKITIQVHDELDGYYFGTEDQVNAFLRASEDIFAQIGRDLKFPIPFLAESGTGFNWAAAKG